MKSNIETMGVYINLPLTRTVERSQCNNGQQKIKRSRTSKEEKHMR